MKKLLMFTMIIGLFFSMSTISANANEESKEVEKVDYKKMISDMEKMSVKELNELIDKLYQESQEKSSIGNVDIVKLAWIAAGEIAKLNGYECAGELVIRSAKNENYSEQGSGIFVTKIKESSDFQNYMQSISGIPNVPDGSFKFKSSDLFYALHNVSIATTAGYPYVYVNITDVFDFAYDNNYDSVFTSLVNNWAWLCQNTGSLNPISISISFYLY